MVRLPFLVRYFWPYAFFMEGRHSAGDEGVKRGLRQRRIIWIKKIKNNNHLTKNICSAHHRRLSQHEAFFYLFFLKITFHSLLTSVSLKSSSLHHIGVSDNNSLQRSILLNLTEDRELFSPGGGERFEHHSDRTLDIETQRKRREERGGERQTCCHENHCAGRKLH